MQRIAKFFARYDAADMSLLTYSRRQSYNKVLKLPNDVKNMLEMRFHSFEHLPFIQMKLMKNL